MNVRMRRVASMEDIREIGDFCFVGLGDRRSIVIRTPSEPNAAGLNPSGYEQTAWPISPHATRNNHSWTWDGNEDAPTLEPSLHHKLFTPQGEVTLWHGWVKAGEQSIPVRK